MSDKKPSPLGFIEQLHKTMTLDEVNVYLNNLNREQLRKNPTQDVVMGGKSYWKDAKVTHSPAFLKWLLDEDSEETPDNSDKDHDTDNESQIIVQMRPFSKSAHLTFNTLKTNSNLSAGDIAKTTGLSKSSVYRAIKILLRYEFIQALPESSAGSSAKFSIPARLGDFRIEHVWIECGIKLLKQKEKRRKEFFKKGGKMVMSENSPKLKLRKNSFKRFDDDK
ncbi:HTH domain-containing protein [Limnobacter profundi]|uniref:HTH domain-containing protein n=1 Tax=Limnobacter profundi TaxID=2732163 RepID=A0ABX6N2R4_9BURK|nr:HTH domain-containing protein [Limnobacter sp. SAORIC-580]QJR28220.1 HTH domain-containing protein [Limnobacter sp. SAORIC-580]